MATSSLKRKLTFSAWADTSERYPFDRLAMADALSASDEDDKVLVHDDAITGVELIDRGDATKPTRLRLLALHDAATAPSAWTPRQGATLLNLADGEYSAFIAHVAIWPNKIAAHDAHANAPGLGRLSTYLFRRVAQRVAFRALYEQGLAEQLDDLDGVRGLEIGIHNPHKQQTAKGMFGSILPAALGIVPSLRISMSMGRRTPRDAYLPDDLAGDVFDIADTAEQYLDTLKVRGRSKTVRTAAGNPKTIEVNLLSKRLHLEVDLPRDTNNHSVPSEEAVFGALSKAYSELHSNGKLASAVEARVLLDQQP